jgi:hypothetical protein
MTKEEWGQAHFRFAQSPQSWLLTAETLIDAATQIYFSAAEQAAKFEAASTAATEKARSALGDAGSGSASEEILEAEPKFLPAFMLYGFAIENLLKGILVAQDGNRVGDKKINVPRTHNLVELADEAKISLSAAECDLLKRLSTITTWSGRYPAAASLADFAPIGIAIQEKLIKRHADDYAATILFINKLKAMLPAGRDKRRGGVIVVWRGDLDDDPDE